MPVTKCRCGRLSYGFPLCSHCRRKANDGRALDDGRVAKWNKGSKVFEAHETLFSMQTESVREGR